MENSRASSPWWVVAGSALGLIVGNGPVMQFTFGVFVKPLSEAFNTDRGTVSAALLVGLVATGLATPLVGRAMDRAGIRTVALPAITLFALGMAAIGLLANSPLVLMLLYGLTGLAAAGQTPLPYSKSIIALFDRRRGLALGIAMAGVGIGTALMPFIAQRLIVAVGWRGAYVALGALTLLIALPSMAVLVARPGRTQREASLGLRPALEGLTAAEARRTPKFWVLGIAFFTVAMAAAGVVAHIVPLLTDRGVDPRSATAAISAAGLALIVGRLLAGWALDKVHAPRVAIVFFALPLIGILLLLLTSDLRLALLAAVLVGLGLGAEVDLIAFLQSRYLGMRAFGEIYGYLFAIFMLGSGLGPFLMGTTFHRFQGYSVGLASLACGLVLACFLMLRLGPYVYGTTPEAALDPSVLKGAH